jgi:hypothetical protein
LNSSCLEREVSNPCSMQNPCLVRLRATLSKQAWSYTTDACMHVDVSSLLALLVRRVTYKDGQMEGEPRPCAAVKGTQITVSNSQSHTHPQTHRHIHSHFEPLIL